MISLVFNLKNYILILNFISKGGFCMPRVPRKDLNSNYFHVIVQGIEKKYVFEHIKYKQKYKELLMTKAEESKVKLLVYCIMDNHAHMIIYSEKIENLSKYMQKANTSFAVYYNKLNQRVGYIFRSRFRSIPIRSEKQLARTMIYIHLNPVQARICSHPGLYDFSSYNDYIMQKGIATNENARLLNINRKDSKIKFEFMHSLLVDGEEFTEESKEKRCFIRIEEYIKENEIIDIVFQPEKVKKMIEDLKKEKISFTMIAKYLEVTPKKLKEIIEEL